MRLIKLLLAGLFVFIFFVFGFGKVLAETEFSIDALVKYNVQKNGITQVTHSVSLENNFSTLYATSYTFSLENITAENVKITGEHGEALEFTEEKIGDVTNIKITFPNAVVGKGSKRLFNISYENRDFAVKTGEVWEVSIPKVGSDSNFRKYDVNLFIPSEFGLEAYISPQPLSSEAEEGGKIYTFTKDEVSQTGITAGFGQFQVFSFNLAYHLENPLTVPSQTQISLPPDTAYQKVYLQNLTPKPEKVFVDPDGNWIAQYKLSPRQRVDIMATGSVQIFASYRSFPKPTEQEIIDNLKESEYWQINNTQIKELANKYTTPRQIYDYVSGSLKYDFSRVQPNVQRLGAVKALESPSQAICMEFTDLFIAIARAAGIPAREINGYAYTENPELQPLSLVADVLHSWPEYYDSKLGVWIPVDPTWASTTGGVDFFNQLDLRHFAFVVHGKSPTLPYPPGSYKLGANPQKDVFVSFGKLPSQRLSTLDLTAAPASSLRILTANYKLKIYNPGPTALYSLYPTVYFDKKQSQREFIEVLPPYSGYDMQIKVPFSLLGKDTPDVIKIVVESSEISIPTNKTQIIINSLLSIFAVFASILILLLVRLKKITFNRLTATIRAWYEKFRGSIGKKSDKRGS